MKCEKHYWYHGPLVDCPHCEIDRLRAELENKNELVQFFIDLATEYGWNGVENSKILTLFWLTFVEDLTAELAKAQEGKATALADQRRRLGAEFDEVSLELQDVRKKAVARIKQLELLLSGRTMVFDPESYQKGRIEGMEEAENIISDYRSSYDVVNDAIEHLCNLIGKKIDASRIKEIKG